MPNKKIIGAISLTLVLIGISSSSAQPAHMKVQPVTCEKCVQFPVTEQRWNYVLNQKPSLGIKVDVYNIDGFDNSASMVASIHGMGAKAICYINAGVWEDWRPDANDFPAEVIGKNNGSPHKKWLDIRQIATIGPQIYARVQMCKSKGFDGIEFDNVESYLHDTGFEITADDQLNYNSFISNLARREGLAAGLKNDVEQIPLLLSFFDFAINERCFENNTCESLRYFIKADKAVFHVEYKLPTSKFCSQANALLLSSIKKNNNLNNHPVNFCN